MLRGDNVEGWRAVALVEHRGPMHDLDGPRPARSATSLYVEYADGEKECHDLVADPYELRNAYASLPDDRKAALRGALDAVENCRGVAGCQAAERVERTAFWD